MSGKHDLRSRMLRPRREYIGARVLDRHRPRLEAAAAEFTKQELADYALVGSNGLDIHEAAREREQIHAKSVADEARGGADNASRTVGRLENSSRDLRVPLDRGPGNLLHPIAFPRRPGRTARSAAKRRFPRRDACSAGVSS